MDMNSLRHLLYDVHDLDEVLKIERFQDYDKGSIDILLDSVKDFCDKDAYPTFREMDEDPARFENGGIYVHPKIKRMLEVAPEFGFSNGMFDYEDGGLQMPNVIQNATSFILDCANINMGGYPSLTAGAAALIVAYGKEELKKTWTPKMLDATWGGTMCLTEPQAGSSLSDITTSATPQDNDTYKIKGQKIFISGGDHEYCDNFVHLVLARIDGAPAGTKGISLFVVPKKRYDADNNLEANDVLTAGDFQKLGQRGFCTTHIIFGEGDDCEGYLVGEQNRGLTYMFQMMNGARIGVGRHGAALATAAYYASLQYAEERSQGRRINNAGTKDISQGQTSIKNHPDVRRMLLLQKAVSEGATSLILEASILFDKKMYGSEDQKEHAETLLEMLTPMVKTYPAEMGMTSINNGLQILGGYGFCSEYVLQQYYRDIRIMSLYEGTTGIQSMDLLGRKVTMNAGAGMRVLAKEMIGTIKEASNYDALKPYADALSSALKVNQKVLEHLAAFAMKGEYERFISDATIYMEMLGTITIAWQWLKIATSAKKSQLTGDATYSNDFYEGKIHTMRFFYKYELPKINTHSNVLMSDEVLTIVDEKELIA